MAGFGDLAHAQTDTAHRLDGSLPIVLVLLGFSAGVIICGFFALYWYRKWKATEAELCRLRAGVEETSNSVFVTDEQGTICYVNPAFEITTGFSAGEVLGANANVLNSGRQDHSVFDELWRTIQGGDRWTGELVNKRKDGKYYYARQSITPVSPPAARRTWYVAVQHDVSNRKIVEDALAESERQYRLLAENATDRIFRHGPDGTFTYASPAAVQLLGGHPDELIGTSILDLCNDEDRAHLEQALLSVGGGPMDVGRRTVQFRARRLDGNEVWCEMTGKAVLEPMGGGIEEIIAVTRDISDRKEIEFRLVEAKSQAEEANRVKGEFLANVSHEIKTPINIIIGIAEMLLRSEEDEGRKRSLAAVASAAGGLSELISDILDLSRLEAGRLELVPRWFSPRSFASDIEALFKPGASAKGLGWNMVVGDDLPDLLYMDDRRLRQVVINLVGNAIKFTTEGEIGLLISCAIRSAADDGTCSLHISVSDTGIGIPADKREVIFDTFRQSDGDIGRRFGGTGLGLPISKRLVETMGGSLSLSSDEGLGSSFTVSFPQVEWGTVGTAVSDETRTTDAILADEAPRSFVSLDRRPGEEEVTAALAAIDRLDSDRRLKTGVDLADHWKRVMRTQVFDEITFFASVCEDQAARVDLPELARYARVLRRASTSFDVTLTQRLLSGLGPALGMHAHE